MKSVIKFLPSQIVAWRGAPRIHHYFQVWSDVQNTFTSPQTLPTTISRSSPLFTLPPPRSRTPLPHITPSMSKTPTKPKIKCTSTPNTTTKIKYTSTHTPPPRSSTPQPPAPPPRSSTHHLLWKTWYPEGIQLIANPCLAHHLKYCNNQQSRSYQKVRNLR